MLRHFTADSNEDVLSPRPTTKPSKGSQDQKNRQVSPEDVMCMFHMCMLDAQDTIAAPSCTSDLSTEHTGRRFMTERDRERNGYLCLSCGNDVCYASIRGNKPPICFCSRCGYVCRRHSGLDGSVLHAVQSLVASSALNTSAHENKPLFGYATPTSESNSSNESDKKEGNPCEISYQYILKLAVYHPTLWLRYMNVMLIELYKSYYESSIRDQVILDKQSRSGSITEYYSDTRDTNNYSNSNNNNNVKFSMRGLGLSATSLWLCVLECLESLAVPFVVHAASRVMGLINTVDLILAVEERRRVSIWSI